MSREVNITRTVVVASACYYALEMRSPAQEMQWMRREEGDGGSAREMRRRGCETHLRRVSLKVLSAEAVRTRKKRPQYAHNVRMKRIRLLRDRERG